MKYALVLLLAWSGPVLAQPADCVARPNGPALPMEAWIGLDGQPGVPKGMQGAVKLGLGSVPANGTMCGEKPDLPDDVLHGAPAPHGLLRGDGPRDVLHDRPEARVTVGRLPEGRVPVGRVPVGRVPVGRVVVTPMPNAPPP